MRINDVKGTDLLWRKIQVTGQSNGKSHSYTTKLFKMNRYFHLFDNILLF